MALRPHRLRHDYQMKHAKTGETLDRTHYHKGYLMNTFPEATSRVAEAKVFASKALAENYARKRGLWSRGYRPEPAT